MWYLLFWAWWLIILLYTDNINNKNANKKDMVKFKGTMTKWSVPLAKQTQSTA